MKKIFALCIVAFAACTNPETGAGNAAGKEPVFNGLRVLSLPLVIDTNFILKTDTAQRISYQELRGFGMHFLAHEASQELAYSFNDLCKIDSLKQHHAYKAYVDSLDIGMTKDAVAYKLGYVALKDSALLLIWRLANNSYEACPVFAGTKIIGSYRDAQNNYTHVLLGEMSYWMDPPSSYNIITTGEVTANGRCFVQSLAVSDDMDVAGEETTTTQLALKIENAVLKIVKAEKQVKSTEKEN